MQNLNIDLNIRLNIGDPSVCFRNDTQQRGALDYAESIKMLQFLIPKISSSDRRYILAKLKLVLDAAEDHI
eukprot:3759649-Pyramimonas_sp.AAC.1